MTINTPNKDQIMEFLRTFPNTLFSVRDIAESTIERIPDYELTSVTSTIRNRLESLESRGEVFKKILYTDNGQRMVFYGVAR